MNPPPMPPARPPLPSTPDMGNGGPSWRETFSAMARHIEALGGVVGKLEASTAKLRPWLFVAVGVLVGTTIAHGIAEYYIASKMADVSKQNDEVARLLVRVHEESATKQQVQDVKSQVQEVQASQPQVEIRNVDAGAGRPSKPSAVVVVRPKSSAAPAVTIPLQLPPGSRTEPSDAGTPQ